MPNHSKSLVAFLLLVVSVFGSARLFAKASSPPRLSDLPLGSYSLEGTVDQKASKPFACAFGKYKIKVDKEESGRKEVKLEGSGILMNSGWMHTAVGANPDITYLFPANEGIKDGATVSVFCNSSGTPGRAPVEYYVLEKSE